MLRWCSVWLVFFFFRQRTATEIKYGLVGSGMCIRDRVKDKCVGNQFAIYFGKSPDGTKLYATHMHVGKMHVKKVIKSREDN